MPDPLTHLLLIRHGESSWNRAGRIQGQRDPGLSELGQAQAARLAAGMRVYEVSAVYSSPLLRAHDTAAAIAGGIGAPVRLDPRLMEAGFGEWEGLTRAEAAMRFPAQIERWHADPIAHRPPGGETIQALQARAMAAVAGVVERHRGETVAIVTHAGVIRAALCGLLELPLAVYPRLRLENASISRLLFTPRRIVLAGCNDIAHLRDDG